MFLNKLKEKVTQHKKRWIAAGLAVTLCVGGALAYPAMAMAVASAGGGGDEQGVYKESPVTRGDVTVGVNESGTASLEAIAITYDDYSSNSSSDDSSTVKALVEEVYVKAGQRVKEGDAIAKISTDEISSSLDTLQQDRKAAQLALEKAKLDEEAGLITAKTTLDERQNDATNADLNYELDIDENNANLANLLLTWQNYQEKVDTADEALEEFMGMGDDYRKQISDLDAQIAAAEAEGRDEDAIQLRVARATVAAALEDYTRNYQTNRVKIYAEYSSARNNVDSAKLKYEVAQNSQTVTEGKAASDRTTALSYKDKAQQLYDLEVGQLANSTSSRALALENLDKKITKLQAYLTDGQVKATCDGLIMNVYVVAGDKVNPDDTLASISNSKNIYMSVSIDQEDISTLELGKAANIAFDAYPDKKITGKVDSISVTPAGGNTSTVSYRVKVKLDTQEESVYEGMTGSVTFVTTEVKDVLTVSSKAIYVQDGALFVKVKAADGTITPMPVETGLSDGIITEIISGLNEGDIAIIESKAGVKQK